MELMHNICGAGTLHSIVFCCAIEKECPFRTKALNMLGITEEEYTKIKEKNCIEADVCYGNLAYCCSPEKKCAMRDSALEKLGWSIEDYLNYKSKILRDFVAIARNKDAFNQRVIQRFAVIYCDLDTGEEYRGLAMGTTSFLRILQFVNKSKVDIELGNGLMVILDGEEAEVILREAKRRNCGVSEVIKQMIRERI